jgi:hypothetical protein
MLGCEVGFTVSKDNLACCSNNQVQPNSAMNLSEYDSNCLGNANSCNFAYVLSGDKQRCCPVIPNSTNLDNQCNVTACQTYYTKSSTENRCCINKANAISYGNNCVITKCANSYYLDTNSKTCVSCINGTVNSDGTKCCPNIANVSAYNNDCSI